MFSKGSGRRAGREDRVQVAPSAKFYVDSNVFFYAKIADRVFGKACADVLEKIAPGRMEAATSALVALEVANALREYGLSNEVTAEVRAIFSLGIEVYAIDAADTRDAAEIYHDAKISPYDCAHAAVMRKNGLEDMISADKDFDKIAWLKRVDPRSL